MSFANYTPAGQLVGLVGPRELTSGGTMATDSFARQETGQDLIEYGLLVMLIALVAVAGVQSLGIAVGQMWTRIGTDLAAVFM